MSRFFLKLFNFLLNTLLMLFILSSAGYACFALWDNNHIYSAVEDVQSDMIKLKPPENAADTGDSFQKLQSINPDVRAWISMDNTDIDYPVLQGESNMSYINVDVYGEFALAGSIFMDSRSAPDFSDRYNLLYGHHMDGGLMFGDLDKFKERRFFDKNGSGTLILPDKSFELNVFAVYVVKASDQRIFNPHKWQQDVKGLPDEMGSDALFLKEEALSALQAEEGAQVLALTTCTNEFTDARTIVLAVMTPTQAAGMEE